MKCIENSCTLCKYVTGVLTGVVYVIPTPDSKYLKDSAFLARVPHCDPLFPQVAYGYRFPYANMPLPNPWSTTCPGFQPRLTKI